MINSKYPGSVSVITKYVTGSRSKRPINYLQIHRIRIRIHNIAFYHHVLHKSPSSGVSKIFSLFSSSLLEPMVIWLSSYIRKLKLRVEPWMLLNCRQFYNSSGFPTARGPAMLYDSHHHAPQVQTSRLIPWSRKFPTKLRKFERFLFRKI